MIFFIFNNLFKKKQKNKRNQELHKYTLKHKIKISLFISSSANQLENKKTHGGGEEQHIKIRKFDSGT